MKRGVRRGVLAAIVVTTALVPSAFALDVRPTKFVWDKTGLLRGTFNFRDAVDNAIVTKKFSNGLSVTLVMRGYVYPSGGSDPIALTAHTCRVAFDLWNEVYNVVVNGVKKPPVVNLKGVYRLCTDMVELPIADRVTLANNPANFYMAVKVEVNPISDETLKKIQSWVTRPSGASGSIGPGDALFASFLGVFMKKVATADYVVEFKTPAFPP